MDQFQNFGGYAQPGVWQGQSVNTDTRSFCQTLSEEEMKSLEQAQDEFTLLITKEDQLRAICMHRDINGHNMLDTDPITGEAKCKICGKSFSFVDKCTDTDIENAVKNLIDILQTTKALYLDMPVNTAKNFYTILALLEKVPGLYKIATDNFAKHENAMVNWRYGQNNAINEYNMLYSGYYPQQAGFGAPYGMQPNYGAAYGMQQPTNVMGGPIPTQNQGNPFGYSGAPVAPMYQPQVQGYAYTVPGAPVAPVAPVPPQPTQVATVPEAAPATPETVEVNTQFQA